MRAHLPVIVTHKNDIKIFFIVRKISGGLLAGRSAITGDILAEIFHRQFCFARRVFEEVFQLWRSDHPWNARERNRSPAGRREGGFLSHSRFGETQNHTPQENRSDPGPHAVVSLISWARESRNSK